MPTSPSEEAQRERRRRERWMGDLDRKWEAQEEEDDRLQERWGELLKQGDAARKALGDADAAAPTEGVAVCVPTDDELAVALSWLHTDEPEYSASAAAGLVDAYESTRRQHAPGTTPLRVAGKALFVVVTGAGGVGRRRVVGLLTTREPRGGIDFIVTAASARGKGVAAAAVTNHVESALKARGCSDHEIEALPAAVKFWSKLGYCVVKDDCDRGSDGKKVLPPNDAMRIKTPVALARAKRRKARQPVTMRLFI